MPASTRSGQRLAERFIQVFVITVLGYGWYAATFNVGFGWLILQHQKWVFGGLYTAVMNTLLVPSLYLYLKLCSDREIHGVPFYPYPDKSLLLEPYESINSQGDLAICDKGDCNGKWKPPRTHHCSTCGVCRMGFDHHCPWVGNCVTLARMRSFLLLLCLIPIACLVGIAPIGSTLWHHILHALEISRLDPWATEHWWNWYGSWIFVGGPFGRWIVGILLGFRILERETPDKGRGGYGSTIEQPHFQILVIVMMAILFSVFSLALFISTSRALHQGQTSLEQLASSSKQKRQRFVCIPETRIQAITEFVAQPIEQGDRLYDLGLAANLKALLDDGFWMPRQVKK